MATTWFRELRLSGGTGNAGQETSIKAYAIWMIRVLGFSLLSQSVNSGSWVSVEGQGSSGKLNISGSDFILEDTTGTPFSGVVTGDLVCVKDPVNPRNSGVYEATAISGTQLSIDFRSAPTEYPTQNLAGNIQWAYWSPTYQLPTGAGNYVRLKSPAGYGIELYNHTHESWAGRIFTVINASMLPDSWGKRIGLDGGTRGGVFGIGYAYTNQFYWYAAADTEGKWIMFFSFQASTGTNHSGGGILQINHTEDTPVRSIADGYVVSGGDIYASTANTFVRGSEGGTRAWGNFGSLFWWSDKTSTYYRTYMMDYGWDSKSTGTFWTGRENNCRSGQIELLPCFMLKDKDNTYGEYEIAGYFSGFHIGRVNMVTRSTLDYNGGVRNKFHIYDGVVIDWPGVSPQF